MKSQFGAAVLRSLRHGSRLDVGSVRGYAWLLAAVNVLTLVVVIATSREGIDRYDQIIGSDFLSFWATGRLLVEGALPYDAAARLAAMQQVAPALAGYPAYFYPPSFLPLCFPMGLLPYFLALTIWMIASGAAYYAPVRKWFARCAPGQPVWLWVLAFPPVVITVLHGQTSFLLAALVATGLAILRDKPWLAGFLLGLATFKPQFGILVPIALLATGSWRAIAGAALGAASLAAIATFAFGTQVWTDWLALGREAEASMTGGAIGFGKMVSAFAAARLVGLSEGVAYAIQGVVTVAVAAMVAWAGWRRQWTLGLAALVMAGTPLATPFVLDYDMVLLAFPLLYLAGQGYRPWEKTVSAAVVLATILARPMALQFGVPIMPFAMAALFWLVWQRAGSLSNGQNAGPPLSGSRPKTKVEAGGRPVASDHSASALMRHRIG